MQDAARTSYREGFRDGQASGGDPERTWARGILHLPAGASVPPHELRQRYKRLSLVFHPDQNPGLGDEFIKNLNRAREVLEA
jgi:DnaJ-class molecular chaperone